MCVSGRKSQEGISLPPPSDDGGSKRENTIIDHSPSYSVLSHTLDCPHIALAL
jgi:hypothetical protein